MIYAVKCFYIADIVSAKLWNVYSDVVIMLVFPSSTAPVVPYRNLETTTAIKSLYIYKVLCFNTFYRKMTSK